MVCLIDRKKVHFNPVDILLVEDDPISQDLAVEMLEEAGVNVDVATSEKEAHYYLELNHYQLIPEVVAVIPYAGVNKLMQDYIVENLFRLYSKLHVQADVILV